MHMMKGSERSYSVVLCSTCEKRIAFVLLSLTNHDILNEKIITYDIALMTKIQNIAILFAPVFPSSDHS